MLTKNHRQEALCRAYVQAVAGRCGMTCTFPTTDYGIDLYLHDVGTAGNRHFETGFRLDIQAKSTTRAARTGTHVKYDLRARDYEALRTPDTPCPRLLVVLVLPEEEPAWLTHTEESLILRSCAY